mmetsp:Transcript_33919/g.70018  ORF Transcript_33919/g.70018 Transcript_33919/m.70018 type:complete len:233 (+) Transcript_33919:2-700(+)
MVLGISESALKTSCRRLGIARWPYHPRARNTPKEFTLTTPQKRIPILEQTSYVSAASSNAPLSHSSEIDKAGKDIVPSNFNMTTCTTRVHGDGAREVDAVELSQAGAFVGQSVAGGGNEASYTFGTSSDCANSRGSAPRSWRPPSENWLTSNCPVGTDDESDIERVQRQSFPSLFTPLPWEGGAAGHGADAARGTGISFLTPREAVLRAAGSSLTPREAAGTTGSRIFQGGF